MLLFKGVVVVVGLDFAGVFALRGVVTGLDLAGIVVALNGVVGGVNGLKKIILKVYKNCQGRANMQGPAVPSRQRKTQTKNLSISGVNGLDLAVVVFKGVVVGVTALHLAGVVAFKGVFVGVTGLHLAGVIAL